MAMAACQMKAFFRSSPDMNPHCFECSSLSDEFSDQGKIEVFSELPLSLSLSLCLFLSLLSCLLFLPLYLFLSLSHFLPLSLSPHSLTPSYKRLIPMELEHCQNTPSPHTQPPPRYTPSTPH